jgi:hypothetical protein
MQDANHVTLDRPIPRHQIFLAGIQLFDDSYTSLVFADTRVLHSAGHNLEWDTPRLFFCYINQKQLPLESARPGSLHIRRCDRWDNQGLTHSDRRTANAPSAEPIREDYLQGQAPLFLALALTPGCSLLCRLL